MISGISGVGNNYYLQQLRQAQSNGLSAAHAFGKIDKNGDGSISKDEFATFQASITQFQGSIMGSQSDSTSALLALLQSAGLATGGSNGSTTAASNPATTLNTGIPVAQLFGKIDANGDGSISKDEFVKVGATIHRPHHGAHKAGSLSGSSSPLDQLFGKIDTNGDGSLTKDEVTTFLTNLGTMTDANTIGNKLTATI